MKSACVLITITLIASPSILNKAIAESQPLSKFTYLMYSDPLIIRFRDGTELKLQVTAQASRQKDKLLLVVDDQIVDEGYVKPLKKTAVLRYSEGGLDIRVACTSYLARGNTYNHHCRVKSGGKKIGELDVIKRIYARPQNKRKPAPSATTQLRR